LLLRFARATDRFTPLFLPIVFKFVGKEKVVPSQLDPTKDRRLDLLKRVKENSEAEDQNNASN